MSDDVKTQPPTPGVRGWVRALLVGSLTLNLMVVGLVVGSHVIGDRFDDHERRGPDGHRGTQTQRDRGGEGRLDPAFGPLGRALSGDHRRAVGQELQSRGRPSDMNRALVADELGAMIDVLRSEPFDGAALEAVLDAQSARFTERSALGRSILIERLEGMSVADRSAYADRLEKGFRRAVDRARHR